MSTGAPPIRPSPPPAGAVTSPQAAIDLLCELALRQDPCPTPPVQAVDDAAALLRGSISELAATQADLAEALIATQDQLLDVKALAQISVRAATSGGSLGPLLEKALLLTGASLVMILRDGVAACFRGDPTLLDQHTDLVHRTIAEDPRGRLHATLSDTVMIGALDPDEEARRHVAFFRPAGLPFSTTDIPLLEAITSAIMAMVAFNVLHQRELERAAVEREHQLASVLAQSVISDDTPPSVTLDLFARTVPASLTGGDFYVFGQGDGRIWFTVGDVAGKGLPAAMLMTRAVGACRVAFLAQRDQPVADVFARIEEELYDHLDEAGLFLTLVVGIVDEATRTVSLVNAAHSPVVLVRDGVAETIRSSVPPLGVVRHRVPTTSTFTLEGGDRLLVGSDGLVEQADPDGALFGYPRFTELCRALAPGSSDQIGHAVFDTLGAFADGTPASDDSTLVVVGPRAGR